MGGKNSLLIFVDSITTCPHRACDQVYITIKNNVAGGVRYLSRVHGPVALGGTASAVSGNWFCGQVKGGSYVKIR